MIKRLLLLVYIGLLLASCQPQRKEKEVIIPEEETLPTAVDYSALGLTKLSEYGFFKGTLPNLQPAENVLPYDINSPLFTDYAQKARFIFIPEGKIIQYDPHYVLRFPVGTVLIKNFFYDGSQLETAEQKIIETRLLIREKAGWKALPYIWNEEQTEASLEITGAEQKLTLVGKGPFTYAVPTMNQCKSCHERNGEIMPIGPSARQLNKPFAYGDGRMNQLSKWKSMGWIEDLPAYRDIPRLVQWENARSGNLNARARAYLEINCGHCHRPEGPGKNSGLDLTTFSPNDLTLGMYKGPVAAGKGSGGLKYDIHPGQPDASILHYRMTSTDPAIKMPELGRNLVHEEGVALIREWIQKMVTE